MDSDNKKIKICVGDSEDAAEMMLEILMLAGVLPVNIKDVKDGQARVQLLTNSNEIVPIVCMALSDMWRKSVAALSVGPNQFSEFTENIAASRVQLPAILKNALGHVESIIVPPTTAGSIVLLWLQASDLPAAYDN